MDGTCGVSRRIGTGVLSAGVEALEESSSSSSSMEEKTCTFSADVRRGLRPWCPRSWSMWSSSQTMLSRWSGPSIRFRRSSSRMWRSRPDLVRFMRSASLHRISRASCTDSARLMEPKSPSLSGGGPAPVPLAALAPAPMPRPSGSGRAGAECWVKPLWTALAPAGPSGDAEWRL